MKKTRNTLLLILCMIFLPTVINAEDSINKSEVKSELTIDIAPIIISLTLPISDALQFYVGEHEIYPDMEFVNNNPIPLELSIENIMKVGDNTPSLVPHDKYDKLKWESLSSKETISEMALGIHLKNNKDNVIWLDLNNSFTLHTINPKDKNIYNLTTVSGNRWEEGYKMKYDFTFVARPVF